MKISGLKSSSAQRQCFYLLHSNTVSNTVITVSSTVKNTLSKQNMGDVCHCIYELDVDKNIILYHTSVNC